MPIRKSTPPNPERQLMIKTKTCQRLIKEVEYYKQEVTENEEKLAEMKAANRDPYDIKKFEEVLGESYMMIPDSSARLKQSLQDLSTYVESSEIAEQYQTNEWYLQATEILTKKRENQQGDSTDVVEETIVDELEEGEVF